MDILLHQYRGASHPIPKKQHKPYAKMKNPFYYHGPTPTISSLALRLGPPSFDRRPSHPHIVAAPPLSDARLDLFFVTRGRMWCPRVESTTIVVASSMMMLGAKYVDLATPRIASMEVRW